MKKFFCAILALTMLFTLAACGNSNTPASGSDLPSSSTPVEPQTFPGDEMSISEIKDAVLQNLGEMPMLGDIIPDAESFEYYAFVPYQEGVEIIVSEPMMGSIAHSVVILRTADAESAEAMATEMEANADPRKWICVEAEKTIVTVHGSTVLLVMSAADTADTIAANFDALWA